MFIEFIYIYIYIYIYSLFIYIYIYIVCEQYNPETAHRNASKPKHKVLINKMKH